MQQDLVYGFFFGCLLSESPVVANFRFQVRRILNSVRHALQVAAENSFSEAQHPADIKGEAHDPHVRLQAGDSEINQAAK